jgi:hypothetical protein
LGNFFIFKAHQTKFIMRIVITLSFCLIINHLLYSQHVGIGTVAPRASLEISKNSTLGSIEGAQLLLMEDEDDYARLRMTNSLYNQATNNRYWDIAARIDASDGGVGSLLNFYRHGFGDVLSLRGNGWVGIGTVPFAPLHVQSSQNLTAAFFGANQMYLGLYEQGIYRGYLGSFGGNPADVDFGTGAGNTTGKVHLSLQGQPKLTVRENGYVGINTTNPQWHLDVEGGMRLNGRFFINGTSGSAGQVFTSGGGVNTPSWQTLSSAYDNNVRFAVSLTNTSTGGSPTTSRTVLYNTNTTAVSTPTNGGITINQPGLYHFEGNFALSISFNTQTVADHMLATLRFSAGSDVYDTHFLNSFKKEGTGSGWTGKEIVFWEKDVYISTVPTTVGYGYSWTYNPTNNPSFKSRVLSGIISGYLISP